jgi:hypothetical protein
MFLGLQRWHVRSTIFGIWGLTNSIPPFCETRPFPFKNTPDTHVVGVHPLYTLSEDAST